MHTPGPWLVSPFCARVEVPDADAPICELLWPTDLRSEEETYDNAALIASAPALLEALQSLERYLRDTPHHNAIEAAAARKAIAKAEG